jgi:hypothetical protein
MQNFLGTDGFIWWMGTVENRMDPLGLGRCQVRIFGWHTDGTNSPEMTIPIEDLPWAVPILPLNARNTFSVPELQDWVVGFFMDGSSGQFPIMMGVLPAYAAETNPYGTSTASGV